MIYNDGINTLASISVFVSHLFRQQREDVSCRGEETFLSTSDKYHAHINTRASHSIPVTD